MPPTPLAQAYNAVALLHELIGAPAATISHELGDQPGSGIKDHRIGIHVPLKTPLNGKAPATNLVLAFPFDDPTIGIVSIHNHIPEREFRFSRTNLIGVLGALDHPLINQEPPSEELDTWLLRRLADDIDWEWKKPNDRVLLSKHLVPRSDDPDDALRNPAPYPRFKVFYDGRTAEWTYARLAPNGRDLGPHGPMYAHPHEARRQAEVEALRQGHPPRRAHLDPDILQWHILYAVADEPTITAHAPEGLRIEIQHKGIDQWIATTFDRDELKTTYDTKTAEDAVRWTAEKLSKT